MVKICGVQMYMWRAVDNEGEVLEMLIQKHRNKAAAIKILKRLLRTLACIRKGRHTLFNVQRYAFALDSGSPLRAVRND
ncbi:MAG: DDE-type integrase/transposase/recombinase [Caulobacterales bacterium]